jgi:hypothetical protein
MSQRTEPEQEHDFSLLYGSWTEDEDEKSMDKYSLFKECLSGEPKHLNRRSDAHA